MKRNLVKILAIAGVAASLAACGPKAPKVLTLTIDQAFEQNEDKSFVNADKKVKLENLCVYSNFGTTLVAGVPHAEGGKITSLRGIEVELPELPKWSEGAQPQGTYANVTVEGTLKDVNGRPVLKDASVVVNGEVFFKTVDGKTVRDEEKSTSTYSCAYWSSEQLVRENYDKYLKDSPANSGALMEGMFQLATVPSSITADAENEFKVVFPGENTNGADPENEFVINVKLPKGLRSGAVEFYNDFFSDKAPGDFILFDAISQYDSSKGGMCFLFENQWAPIYTEEVPEEDRPVLISQWSDIQARYEGKYKGSVVPDLGSDLVFSYTLKDNFSGSIGELVGEEYVENWKLDQAKAGAFMALANAGAAHANEAFEQIKAKAAALTGGWALDEDLTDEIADDFYYVLKESDEADAAVIAEINIFLDGSTIGIIFAGIRATDAQVDTFAEALEQYEAVVNRDKAGFETALPALPGTQGSAVSGVDCDWKGYEDVEGFGFFDMTVSFADETFADAEAWQAYLNSYLEALETAGFKDNYFLSTWGANGYYNPTSGEFLYIELSTDDADAPNGIYLSVGAVLNASKAALHCFDLSENGTYTAASALSYCLDLWPMVFQAAPAIIQATYFADGYFKAEAKATIISYIEQYILPAAAVAGSTNPVAGAEGVEYYNYFLPSATEGKSILVQVEVDTTENGLVIYVKTGEVAAQ